MKKTTLLFIACVFLSGKTVLAAPSEFNNMFCKSTVQVIDTGLKNESIRYNKKTTTYDLSKVKILNIEKTVDKYGRDEDFCVRTYPVDSEHEIKVGSYKKGTIISGNIENAWDEWGEKYWMEDIKVISENSNKEKDTENLIQNIEVIEEKPFVSSHCKVRMKILNQISQLI